MPIVVNKEEKTAQICQKAFEEFVENGIENISLNQLISNIGISKGQFYHYFKTKEELIIAVMSHKTIEGFEFCEKELQKASSLKESLFTLFKIYIGDDQYSKDLRKLFFETLHICIHSKDETIKKYNYEYYAWVEKTLFEIFENHNIQNSSEIPIKSISMTADGMYLRSLADNSFDLESNLSEYLIYISNTLDKG